MTDLVCKIRNLLVGGSERSATVKKNVIGSIALKGTSILVSFILVPITIGYVSSELYGVWLTLSSILTWLGFLDIGFTQGLKNRLVETIAAEDWHKGKSLVSTTYFMMIVIFVPVCVLCEFLVPLIDWPDLLNVSESFNQEIVQTMHVLIVFCCLKMIINVIVSVIAAFQKVALSNSFEVIGQILSLLIIIVLTKTCPASLVSLAFSISAMPILVALIGSVILFSKKYKLISPSFHSVDKRYIGELFGLGYKFFIINIQVVVLYQATNVLISNVSSPLQVTSYNIAYKYLNVAMMLYSIVTAPLWPAYTDAYVKEDYAWMNSTRTKMVKVFLASAIGCLLLVALSKPVYSIWVGDKVEVPFLMTVMVGVYVIMYCWMTLNGTLLVGMGKIKLETIYTTCGMLIHIPLSFFLSRYIGAYGVICSMIFINFAYALLMKIQVMKILNREARGIWNE